MINHGTVIAKVNLGKSIKKGDTGIIASWRPNEKKYTFYFLNGEWYSITDIEPESLKGFVEINLDE